MIFSALRCSNGIVYIQTFDTIAELPYKNVTTIAEVRKTAVKFELGNMNCYDWREGVFPDGCLWTNDGGNLYCGKDRPHYHIAWCSMHLKKITKRDLLE